VAEHLPLVALVVRECDEAIGFFVGAFGSVFEDMYGNPSDLIQPV